MEQIKRFMYKRPVALVVGLMAFFNPFLWYLSIDFHPSFATAVWGIDYGLRIFQIVAAVCILALLFVRNLGLAKGFTEHKVVVGFYFADRKSVV